MKKLKSIIGLATHPFAVLIYCLIIGSFGILNNENVADSTIPTYFHGKWSIYVGVALYAFGLLYVGYAIYKTIKAKRERLKNQGK